MGIEKKPGIGGGDLSSNRAAGAEDVRAKPSSEVLAVIAGAKDLLKAVGAYNAQFSFAAGVESLFARTDVFVEGAKAEAAPAPPRPLHELLSAAGNKLNALHQILARTGLSVAVRTGASFVVLRANEKIESRQVQLRVGEPAALNRFLAAIGPPELREGGAREVLTELASSLDLLLHADWRMADPFGADPQLAISLAPLVEHYERLGMAEAVAEIRPYVHATANGYLEEYGEARRQGLLNPIGKYFGPERWQGDATPESLTERWNDAIGILARLKANPSARPLYERLASHLTTCIAIARENLPDVRKAELGDALRQVNLGLTRVIRGSRSSAN